MSEASLWTYIRTRLLPVGIHATRIENDSGEFGFPDVHYSLLRPNGTRASGTIELKFLRKKNPPFGDDGLRLSQRIWIRDELMAGGTVWIMADIGKTIHLIRGKHYGQFNSFGRQDFENYSTLIFVKGKRSTEARADFENFL